MPHLPIAEPPLDRSALLFAVARAASAVASGDDDREVQRKLDDKPFELRMRFGCGGPSPDARDETLGWSFDEKHRVLRIRAAPEIGKDTPLVQDIAGDAFEAVEGFRIARPWMLVAACPQLPPAPAISESPAGTEASATSPTAKPEAAENENSAPLQFIGIAQFFAKTDARTHRRDHRAYQVTKTLAADESPSAKGYDLVLSGRLKRRDDDRVITCRVAAADAPPSCIIAAEFDAVTLERADNAEQVARWSSG